MDSRGIKSGIPPKLCGKQIFYFIIFIFDKRQLWQVKFKQLCFSQLSVYFVPFGFLPRKALKNIKWNHHITNYLNYLLDRREWYCCSPFFWQSIQNIGICRSISKQSRNNTGLDIFFGSFLLFSFFGFVPRLSLKIFWSKGQM